MNAPELERLRAANPVPTDPGAPPIERVLALLDDPRPAKPAARRTRRSVRSLAGPLGALAVAAVVAGVAVAVVTGHHRPRSDSGAIRSLAGGLRGSVEVTGAGFHGQTGFISLSQRRGSRDWLATTTDSGRSWAVKRQRWLIGGPVAWAGENGWASAAGDDPGPGGLLGGGVVVTHDGGATWKLVPTPRSPSPYFVSVADGVVWAVADDCAGRVSTGGCIGQVRRGPTSGSRLTTVPAPPAVGPVGSSPDHWAARPLGIVALSADSAYVSYQFGAPSVPKLGPKSVQSWLVTRNGGAWSWQRVSPDPCLVAASGATVGDGHGTIWRSCPVDGKRTTIAISTDGGRSWAARPAPFSTDVLYAESARVAWAQTEWTTQTRPDTTAPGTTLRTTDGGRSWQRVWTPNDLRFPAGETTATRATLTATHATLTAQSATTATEVVPVTRTAAHSYTNLVLVRTTDGGAHWHQTTVPLPNR